MADKVAVLCQASQSNNVPSLVTGSTALAANTNRAAWSIQNQGTNPLFIRMGSGASNSVFHISLKAGSAVADGNGGIYTQNDGVIYQGIVTASGTGATYTVLEY